MALFNRSLYYLGLLLTGLCNCVECVLHLVLQEEAKEAPESGATTIFVFALSVVITLVNPGRPYRELAESCFGDAVALEDTALPSLGESVTHR